MEFEESLEFDFRAKSLTKLITRLEEMNAALNLGSSFYTIRRPEVSHSQEQLAFRELLPREETEPQILLVIGHKCAGKTTFSDYLAGRGGVMVFEASSVLRQLALEANEDVGSADDAFNFLREHGLDCVAKAIAKYLDRAKLDFGQNLNGLAIVRGAKHGVHQFLYGHGQAETVRKIAVVSVYPANALSSALSKLAKVDLRARGEIIESELPVRGFPR